MSWSPYSLTPQPLPYWRSLIQAPPPQSLIRQAARRLWRQVMLSANHAQYHVHSASCLLFRTLSRLIKVCQLIKEMAEGGTGQLIFFHVPSSSAMITGRSRGGQE